MPHSLRVKLKCLNYKKILTDRELERLCKALDNENVLDKIRAEIKQLPYQRIFGKVSNYSLLDVVVEIIDKYREESENE